MSVRAVIFDGYGTLLKLGPPPDDADARWESLFRDMLHRSPPLGRVDFAGACQRAVAARHEAAHARGIRFPEVSWVEVLAEVLPELSRLTRPVQEEFAFRQIQTSHTARLWPEAADVLHDFARRGSLLGLASNAQAYTLRELSEALARFRLGLDLFDRDLCFWSFEHGYSKPDPHVFEVLATRLAARGIARHETLMIGDRLDNDIEPARAHGWQTWHLTTKAGGTKETQGGDWGAFSVWREQAGF